MNYEEFKNELYDFVKGYAKTQGMETVLEKREKNNRGMMDVIEVRKGQYGVSKVVDDLYQACVHGILDMDTLKANFADMIAESFSAITFDADDLTNYERVKKNIICSFVNYEKNKEFLKDKPHEVMEDLALIYKILIKDSNGMIMGAANVNYYLLKQWDISEKKLHKKAVKNSGKRADITSTLAIASKAMLIPDVPTDLDGVPFQFIIHPKNIQEYYATGAILNDDFMDKVHEKVGKDEIYLLPSSINDWIVMGDDMPEEDLRAMVREANEMIVGTGEWLSDNIYKYDFRTREFEMVGIDKDHNDPEY